MRIAAFILVGGLAGCVVLAPGEAPATELYKWRDAEGNVFYGDRPPSGLQAQTLTIRVRSYTGPPRLFNLSDVPLTFGSDGIVTLYSTEWCGVCKRAKRYMDAHGIAYKEYDVEKDPTGKRHYRMLDAKGVPVFILGDRRMDGFTPERLQALLEGASP